METVTSKDGTRIAYDTTGSGDPLILVAGAFSFRKYSGQVKLAKRLAAHFTVYNYDRRGRGDSTDTPPYRVEREIEDLEALIDAAGGTAYVWGLSSGAALALRAAAAGLKIGKLALQEPPFSVAPGDRRPPDDFADRVSDLVCAGRRDAAVTYFMTAGMGAPPAVVRILRALPGVWARLTAVAHTLPYDAELIDNYISGAPIPPGEWESVDVATLVMCGTERESPAYICHAAAAVAQALPEAQLVVRKGLGHTKKLTPKVITPTLVEFFDAR